MVEPHHRVRRCQKLDSYRVEKVPKQSNVRRLLRLERLLAWDKLDPDANTRFVGVLDDEREQAGAEEEYAEQLKGAGVIDVVMTTVQHGKSGAKKVSALKVVAAPENIEDAFAQAGRKLGGGLHAFYLKARADHSPPPSVAAIKLELFLLVQRDTVVAKVEQRAGELLAAELEKHKAAVRALPDARRDQYRRVRWQSGEPAPEPWELPPSIDAPTDGKYVFDRHLYAHDDGNYRCTLNTWERETITEALNDDTVIGWLRNEPRKPWAFTVPYRQGAVHKPAYPDFLVFRQEPGGVLCDILEPHNLSYDDTVPKAKGLADVARKHGAEFGRIELIARIGGKLKRLRLHDTDTRDAVLTVGSRESLEALFRAT